MYKVRITYDVGGTACDVALVVREQDYVNFCAQLGDVSVEFLTLHGKVNDIDGNELIFVVRRETVCSVDAMSVNNL
jgi:hypothetical protein